MITLEKNDTKNNLRMSASKKRYEMLKSGVTIFNSSTIVSKILNSADFKNAKNVALYLPIKGEIDISAILRVPNKNFYLPRCVGSDMEFVKFNSMIGLKRGKYDILEPQGDAINPSILDIVYVPALMANSRMYRLGWGKGYYDKFFHTHKLKAKKIIVISNNLISDEFVEDNHDYRCDGILSEI